MLAAADPLNEKPTIHPPMFDTAKGEIADCKYLQ
jgi:hypothetical protein